MRHFASLILNLNQTDVANDKLILLTDYFQNATQTDLMWASFLFSGKSLKKQMTPATLLNWVRESAGLPEWLFEECAETVSDACELAAHLAGGSYLESEKKLSAWMEFVESLNDVEKDEKRVLIEKSWLELETEARFVLNKLLTNTWKSPVSQNLLARALAQVTKLSASEAAHRLLGQWHPQTHSYEDVFALKNEDLAPSHPYPFFLADLLEEPVEILRNSSLWQAEWKWDGARSQLIARAGQIFVWNRSEELITKSFPEFTGLIEVLPDGTVLDGEILACREGEILSFADLQTRLSRKVVTAKICKDTPVIFMAQDILEEDGKDLRQKTLAERRVILENFFEKVQSPFLKISPLLSFQTWDDIRVLQSQARAHSSVGLILKKKNSTYESGRKANTWWKLKAEPLKVNGVLIYAERGHGRRGDAYTDYTFGVWNHGELVPFAKAYSGLSEDEIEVIDRFIKDNTQEKFGPVRTVTPELVFEIAFEGIQPSKRHKSGVAVRFPRIVRWTQDKTKEEADTLEHLHRILETQAQHKN